MLRFLPVLLLMATCSADEPAPPPPEFQPFMNRPLKKLIMPKASEAVYRADAEESDG